MITDYKEPMVIISMDEYEQFKRFYADKNVFDELWASIERSNMEPYVNDKGQMMIRPKEAAEAQGKCKDCRKYRYEPQSGWMTCVHPDAKTLLPRENDTCENWEGR